MDRLVYIDGRFVPAAEASISVFDHGLLYGDGVFEGIRAYNGRVFRLDEHLKRLYNGAKAILLEIPLSLDEMREGVLETLRRNQLSDAYIRLVVTRGVGDLGLDPRKCHGGPTVFIIADAIELYPPEFYERGLELITVVTRRNLPEAINPAVKSLNYLNNILAKIEVTRAGLLEGLMLNHEGYVAEATGDNVFLYTGGRLVTPPTSVGILEGITRAAVIELARELGIPIVEERFARLSVYTSDECFLTGTAAEIIPVVMVDGRKIGEGVPGPITKQLMERFRALTMNEGVPIALAREPQGRPV
ncbi:MAG: branched-chain-amino-acid transaminase [Armatimonadota bacterium]|nr:MAG: branched-chain-amino-acid transaminase [Armatimonadota bacterium]